MTHEEDIREIREILKDVARRQQGLTESMQLHQASILDHDHQFKENDRQIKALGEHIKETMAGIDGLLHIAQRHERRLDDLEGHAE